MVMTVNDDRFLNFLSRIESEALRDVALHWFKARGGKRMAAWRDIDPIQIAAHLPIIWSWRYDIGSETFTGRLAGESIVAAFGKSLRGAHMGDFCPSAAYPAWYARNRRVVTEPCYSYEYGAVFRHIDRVGSGERIILPIADDGETGDGIFGATLYDMAVPSDGDGTRYTADNIEYYPL
jgi:hypothetical protein